MRPGRLVGAEGGAGPALVAALDQAAGGDHLAHEEAGAVAAAERRNAVLVTPAIGASTTGRRHLERPDAQRRHLAGTATPASARRSGRVRRWRSPIQGGWPTASPSSGARRVEPMVRCGRTDGCRRASGPPRSGRRCAYVGGPLRVTVECRCSFGAMTAQTLDGEAVAAQIKAELIHRVELLIDRGLTPGLGTVLVGDDGPSANYVAMKHRDCAELGFISRHEHLPTNATQADVLKVVAEFNADPSVDAFLLQYPFPASPRLRGRAAHRRPRQGRRRHAPGEPRQARPGRQRAPLVHAGRHRGPADPLRHPDRRPARGHRRARASPSAGRWPTCSP